jgi:hypothetical protein
MDGQLPAAAGQRTFGEGLDADNTGAEAPSLRGPSAALIHSTVYTDTRGWPDNVPSRAGDSVCPRLPHPRMYC